MAPLEEPIFDHLQQLEHEQLVFCSDRHTGLKAIIAIHNTVLGPGLGGTRMWNYATDQEAIVDALRLSRGMTYKAAISGLNIGGGKAVILGDARTQKNEALMRRFGRFVDSLGGRYVTAEDVNMSTRDMDYIAMETKHVTGTSEALGGGGDPSPFTAYGVYLGMKASAQKAYGSDSLNGKTVLVQGVGQVGSYLVGHLVKEGAKVLVTDIDSAKVKALTEQHLKVQAVDPKDIFSNTMDIYSPCGLGATLNAESVERLQADIVAGGANNQLADEHSQGDRLRERGILYAPDFLINAGGLMNVYADYRGKYNRDWVYELTETIYETALTIFAKSEDENINTQQAAIRAAQERIDSIAAVHRS